jgi:hypothetical protein
MWKTTLLASLFAAAFLSVFFRSVRLRWPENYSTLRGVLEAYVSQGLWRYVVFRTLPVYAVGVFLWVSVDRGGGRPAAGVLVMGAAHVAATNGRAVARLCRRPREGENLANLLTYYLASSLLVSLACLLAALTATHLRPLIPSPDKLAEVAWTGLFAAVLAVTLQSLGRRDLSDASLLDRARAAVGPALWLRTGDAAIEHSTDPDLLRAIVAAEALQRPLWLRRLERLKGRIIGPGTYGIAQVSADEPLSDVASIEELARRFANYMPERGEYGYPLSDRLEFAIERHNKKRAFVEMVITFYSELQGTFRFVAEAKSLDGRPVIEARPVRREHEAWVLSGSASVHEATIAWSAWGNDYEDESFISATIGGPSRGEWELRLPLAARQARLFEPSEDDTDLLSDSRSLLIDLD